MATVVPIIPGGSLDIDSSKVTSSSAAATHGPKKYDPFMLFVFAEAGLIILYAFCVNYGSSTDSSGVSESDQFYKYFQDVHVMMYIGFGFLMTFIRKYGYSAVGFNFLIASFAVQWGALMYGFCHHIYPEVDLSYIPFNMMSMINAEFAAASVLISFGAVLGKLSPTQYLFFAFIQVTGYCINEVICYAGFKIHDVGGSIVIHTFGAYFGLACSMVITPTDINERKKLCAPTPTADIFSMIGTIFLWLYWPSFNGAIALPGDFQSRSVINTYLALASCCFVVFALHKYYLGKFDMVMIQNATLAGGVAVGAAADLVIWPYGAMLVGAVGGIVSMFGYGTIMPWLEKTIGLHDTCGVHNLHGMPGLLGGIISIVAVGAVTVGNYGASMSLVLVEGRSAGTQALWQLAAIGVTLGIAIFLGTITGYILKSRLFVQIDNLFDDRDFWEVPSVELEKTD